MSRRRKRAACSRPMALDRPGRLDAQPDHLRRDRGDVGLRLVVPVRRRLGRGGGVSACLLCAGDEDEGVRGANRRREAAVVRVLST